MDPKPLIFYYARKRWHRHVRLVCDEALRSRSNDAAILFWRCFSVILEENYSEAIRELDSLKNKREMEYPCIAALIYAHKQCKLVDHEEVAQLEAMLPAIEERSGDSGVLTAATFYWLTNDHVEARRIVEKNTVGIITPQTPTQLRLIVLRGWIDLTLQPKTAREHDLQVNSIQYFESDKTRKDLELLLGMAKYFEGRKQYSEALNCIDQVIVMHPSFQPALAEKGMLLLKSGSWEQCIETAQRSLAQNANDIDSLRLLILQLLSREGKSAEAAKLMRNLLEAINRTESTNPELYIDIAKCIARLADRNKTVIRLNLEFVEAAIRLRPQNGAYLAERAYELSLLGDYIPAMESYKDALKVDESNEVALHGMIYCQIMLGQLEDADQQMEFLSVIHESIGANADLAFLQALLAWRKKGDRAGQIRLLDKAVQFHMDALKNVVKMNDASTYHLMVMLNPDFLVEVAKEFLQHAVCDVGDNGNLAANAMTKGAGILEKLIKKSPGLVGAQLALSSAQFLANDIENAARVANKVLHIDPKNAEAHLLMARIDLRREHYKMASASLEEALSFDFSVRQSPIYHLVKAKVLESSGSLDEALKVLDAAMNLPGVRQNSKAPPGKKGNAISLSDRASIYVQLAEVYAGLNRIQDASSVVKEALEVFRNTSEEVRILVVNSQISIQRGDFDAAIRILNNVPQESPAYSKAQMVKADIYLTHRRDKRLYAKCFEDLVQLNPSPTAYIHLGEAYLRISRLDVAIEAFRTALDQNPSDFALANKIGKTLISMHDYLRAVDYYESALQNAPDRMALRHDLVELYVKLKRYDQAARVLSQAPESKSEDINDMIDEVKIMILAAKVNQGSGSKKKVLDSLMMAQSAQQQVLSKIRGEEGDMINEQKLVLATICYRIAKVYEDDKDDDKALQNYNLALRADETHEDTIIALAKLHERRGEYDMCKQQCMTLLRINPSHEEAAIMVANIMFQNTEHEQAVFSFQKLLEDKPDNFMILSKFIVLLRRAGTLDDALTFFKLAEQVGPRSAHSAGLHFCKGLYYRFKNNAHEAIKEFNLARRDGEWGEEAIINMVEVYLSPDNENMWEDTEGNSNITDAIRIAQKLLDELPEGKTLRLRVLEAYAVMATKEKQQIDKAMSMFCDILENDRDYVPALLGMATAHMLQKQVPKARNQLKRIAKMTFTFDQADAFERSYLLLADIYVGRGKYDLAQDLCKKCISTNKSCGKVWEMLGLIMEKEQSYRDAADYYEKAWKFEGEASATVGFKLAFNYLKARRYVEAINVCNKVLADYPDYPKIRKEILEKAQSNLRP